MVCQCNNIQNLKNDIEKLNEMINILKTASQRDKLEIKSKLNNIAQSTGDMVKPDNIKVLMQYEKSFYKDVLVEIEKMNERCNGKRNALSRRIRDLQSEDRLWHLQDNLKIKKN